MNILNPSEMSRVHSMRKVFALSTLILATTKIGLDIDDLLLSNYLMYLSLQRMQRVQTLLQYSQDPVSRFEEKISEMLGQRQQT